MTNGIAIADCTYIVPSKRSGVFLKEHLAERLKKTLFTPPIITIEEFVQEISGLQKASNLELLLCLYKCYLDIPIAAHDNFDMFLQWGETILQDFNEIDRYLLPADEILRYLKSIKELDHWSLQPKKTRLVKNYLGFWENIESLYQNFQQALLSKGIGHQGLIYRIAEKKIIEYSEQNPNNVMIFLGFNALNTAESNIIQHLIQKNQSDIFWDIDEYFLNDSVHDAGLFIRRYLKEWPYYSKNSPKGIHNAFFQKKKINITGTPKSISQAKQVAQILAQHSDHMKEVAIVLADESLLFPIVKAIPEHIDTINITMGLSLKSTLFYSFLISLFKLSENQTSKGWFHKDLVHLFSNPYFQKLTHHNTSQSSNTLINEIKLNNTAYVSKHRLKALFETHKLALQLFPFQVTTPKSMITYCLNLIDTLKTLYKKEKNILELEYLYRFSKLFTTLLSQTTSVTFIKDIKTVHSFFQQLATIESLDFIGSPTDGVQVMGVLESRTLDFETVIITSLNEGILPAGKNNSSFIPFDVKREYGLPTYKEKDAIYTYHFYRLLQRAKNVFITYNTEPDVLEGGEKSRLVSQLMTDTNIAPFVTHGIASPKVVLAPKVETTIIKTPALLSELEKLASKGFSPTSLSNYIKNPLEFYKRNILKLQDPVVVQEDIAANTFGTIVHEALYTIYHPYLGQLLTKEVFETIQEQIPLSIKQAFAKHSPNVDLNKGRYLIIYHVITKYVQNFVAMEAKLVKNHSIRLLHLEERYEALITYPNLPFPIKLKGVIDRIDEFDGHIRVIDYKTGLTEPAHLKIKQWDQLTSSDAKSKAFQLLCYAYLVFSNQIAESMTVGIYAIKNLKYGLLQFSNKNDTIVDANALNAFQKELEKLILEIYNEKVPFTEVE